MAKLVADIDPSELACRIAEGAIGVKRPKGVTPQQALSDLDKESRDGFYRAAYNAAQYMTECFTAAGSKAIMFETKTRTDS